MKKPFVCIKCGSTNKYKHARGMCQKCYDLWWSKNNREKCNSYARKFAKNNRDKMNEYSKRWIIKKYGSEKEYSMQKAEKKLLKLANKFFDNKDDAKIFVYDGIELDKKLGIR